jgi:serine protease AprX
MIFMAKTNLRRLTGWSMLIAALVIASSVTADAQVPPPLKLDALLQERAVRNLTGRSRVLVQFRSAKDVRAFGSTGQAIKSVGTKLHVASIANRALLTVAADNRVAMVMLDRPTFATNERTGVSTGATAVKQQEQLTGKNVGVAVIDSGIATYHDDLIRTKTGLSPRLAHFKNFTLPTNSNLFLSMFPTDFYGHGTHVAGVIAGNGFDSKGDRAGIAPGSKIIALKVLDDEGHGYISDVIQAIDYAISKKTTYNIRVINLSVAAGVFESYANDPLTVAARRAVDAGIVVVASAGNLGQNAEGETQFGGITSPGNAPWVLTVGAASHAGTDARGDDTIADFSSRGPTFINFSAKPDILAYGVGTESLASPLSTMYQEMPQYLIQGSVPTLFKPYLSLTGTSMSAPVVAGTIALMLEANPQLTPNAVKALIQYTAEVTDGHILSQGAGILNAKGAVRMAKYFKQAVANSDNGFPQESDVIEGEQIAWAKHIIWGNFRVTGGMPLPGSNAWATSQRWGDLSTPTGGAVVWGAADDADDSNIVWSTADDGNIVWSTADDDGNIVWSTDEDSNIVWSTGDAADDANIVWSTDDDGNIVWSTDDDGNIVWSTDDDGNIVWSTDDDGNIVWSTFDDEDNNIVWSTAVAQNVVWGNDCGGRNCPQVIWGAMMPFGAGVWGVLDDDGNIVWSTDDDGNIVWSTDDDGNIVWSTAETDGNIVWSTVDDGNIVWSTDDDGNIVWSTADDDGNIVWSTDDDGNIVWSTDDDSNIVWSTGAPQQVLWPAGS